MSYVVWFRRFQETQRKAYADIQCKARRDKNTLIHLILSAEQHDTNAIDDSGNDVLDPTTPRVLDSDVINDNAEPGDAIRRSH